MPKNLEDREETTTITKSEPETIKTLEKDLEPVIDSFDKLKELKSLTSLSLYEDVFSVLKIEKDPTIRDLVIYNSRNMQKRSIQSDIYICSIPNCSYSGDKWFMFKHPCKSFNNKDGKEGK